MVKFFSMQTGIIKSNCYIIYNDNGECIIIDNGGAYNEIANETARRNLSIKAFLITHGHFDHIMGIKNFMANGIKIYIHKDDSELLKTNRNMVNCDFKKGITADYLLTGGESLDLIGYKIKVIHTPGHSKGGVCYLIENVLFSGDTLFLGEIGRTDLYGGNYNQLINSIKTKLLILDDKVIICPGHGAQSTIARERALNPYLGD